MSKNVAGPERDEHTQNSSGEQAATEEMDREEPGRSSHADDAPAANPGDDAATAEAEVVALQREVEELQAELSEVNDKVLRQAAEFQNYRRRTEQEKSKMMETGQRHVLLHMLEVLDDFERSLQAADQVEDAPEDENTPEYASLREGVEFVYQKFVAQLQKLGVEPIEAVGEPFDENLHEAVLQQPAPEDTEEGTILEEVQKGYVMGERVLRHSKVVVAA